MYEWGRVPVPNFPRGVKHWKKSCTPFRKKNQKITKNIEKNQKITKFLPKNQEENQKITIKIKKIKESKKSRTRFFKCFTLRIY